MERRPTLCLLVSLLLSPLPAAAEGMTLAVVAPKDGSFAILGAQVFAGARKAAEARGDTIVEIAEACDEAADGAVATAIVGADADAAVGFLCTESLAHALPALADVDIAAITVSVRAGVLMEDALKKGWPLFRLAPAPGAEAAKVVEVISSNWAAEPFALIDDGTIHARELTEAVRLKLEERGLKAAFVDTFRPAQEQQLALVRRLASTGVTRVFVGGDRGDTAVMARDAKAEGLALSFLGGEALVGADQPVPLPDGVRAIALPPYERAADAAKVAKALAAEKIIAEGYVLPAHAAATVALEAAGIAAREQRPVAETILKGRFETVIGTVRFGADHELADNPYRLLEWQDGRFILVDAPDEGQ